METKPMSRLTGGKPRAMAVLRGNDLYPAIHGEVRFFDADGGAVIEVEAAGLPVYQPASPGGQPRGPFGFHIHSMPNCAPMGGADAFSEAGSHYNPNNQLHGGHAGDLPVLWAPEGKAYMSVYTPLFTPRQVVGRTVMIHENPDDFRTQPSGNSGIRIACGTIVKL